MVEDTVSALDMLADFKIQARPTATPPPPAPCHVCLFFDSMEGFVLFCFA